MKRLRRKSLIPATEAERLETIRRQVAAEFPGNAQLIRFAKLVLDILRQSSDSDPDISQVYDAAQRCHLDTRHHSGDDE